MSLRDRGDASHLSAASRTTSMARSMGAVVVGRHAAAEFPGEQDCLANGGS